MEGFKASDIFAMSKLNQRNTHPLDIFVTIRMTFFFEKQSTFPSHFD